MEPVHLDSGTKPLTEHSRVGMHVLHHGWQQPPAVGNSLQLCPVILVSLTPRRLRSRLQPIVHMLVLHMRGLPGLG